MPIETSVSVPVTDHEGVVIAELMISVLPRRAGAHAKEVALSMEGGSPLLVEGTEYRYEIQSDITGYVSTDTSEIFHPDSPSGISGRLRTGLYVGTLSPVIAIGNRCGTCTLEVRSGKLGYDTHYQLMLRDIAESLAEAILQRFAPSTQDLEVDRIRDSASLYQRFCFLSSIFQNPAFNTAFQQIVSDPYVKWSTRSEYRNPASGIRVDSAVARQISRPGPRISWSGPTGSPASLPEKLRIQYSEETRDNVPIRFIKYVLAKWQAEIALVAAALEAEKPNSPVARGLSAVRMAQAHLEEMLSAELFRTVGSLQYFPSDNPVLLSREGYREVMHAYLMSELAGKLVWAGGEDVYGAGKKDVAALYEYWVFLQLGKIVGSICNIGFSLSSLLEQSDNGLSLRLHRNRKCVLRGTVHRLNRSVHVELWFNRTFGQEESEFASWSRSLRPDMSMLIEPEAGTGTRFDPIWLHFDAKYRVNSVREVLDGAEELSLVDGRRRAVSSDLTKMHAYRDAIRRSAGAFVIYPGASREILREYEEILPGLGAFPLTPGIDGTASGTRDLAAFLDDVITHVCSQLSQHERARYWASQVYQTEPAPDHEAIATPYLDRPPADTLVLLGYVRSAAHLDWIRSALRYNLRADPRSGRVLLGGAELAAPYVLLYGRALAMPELWMVSGYPELRTGRQLDLTGYPSARGSLYFCLPLQAVATQPLFSWDRIREFTGMPPRGAPRVVRWDQLAQPATD